jgi:hypothetical protein
LQSFEQTLRLTGDQFVPVDFEAATRKLADGGD